MNTCGSSLKDELDRRSLDTRRGNRQISAFGAFWKWYIFSGAWREGKVGVVTGVYAMLYSFLKYFKAWYKKP
ncbi:hypothetical protein AwEntero_03780 [Enterobacterales bacterium]|nr:hypothetical protein AwEntero_03780 [Enterobacterales bacterium]